MRRRILGKDRGLTDEVGRPKVETKTSGGIRVGSRLTETVGVVDGKYEKKRETYREGRKER